MNDWRRKKPDQTPLLSTNRLSCLGCCFVNQSSKFSLRIDCRFYIFLPSSPACQPALAAVWCTSFLQLYYVYFFLHFHDILLFMAVFFILFSLLYLFVCLFCVRCLFIQFMNISCFPHSVRSVDLSSHLSRLLSVRSRDSTSLIRPEKNRPDVRGTKAGEGQLVLCQTSKSTSPFEAVRCLLQFFFLAVVGGLWRYLSSFRVWFSPLHVLSGRHRQIWGHCG